MNTDPVQGLDDFFKAVWGSVEGFVYIPVKDRTNNWEKFFFAWPRGKAQVIDHVLTQSAAGRDVYFSPVIWAEAKKPTRENVKCVRAIWADFDGSTPDEWSTPRQQAGSEAPAAVPGHPSLMVQSSTEGHQHVYWLLDEPTEDLDRVQGINRAVAYTYGADTSGWDIEQILRPPFTVNNKRKMQVVISSFDGTRYSIDQFSGFAPIKDLVRESVDTSNLPDPLGILGKYEWDLDTLNLLQKDSLQDADRSGAMMRIAYTSAEKGLTDTEAYALLLFLDDKWGKFKNRNDRERRLLDMVNKARQKFPHAITEPTFEGLRNQDTPVAVDFKYVYGVEDFLAEEFHVDWVVKELIAEGSISLIAGPPGVGKSQLAIGIAANVALGKNFIGYEIGSQRRNLFLSLEMPHRQLHKLMSTMMLAYTGDERRILNDNFLVSPLGESIPLHLPIGRAFLENLIATKRPDGIYIDSLGKILMGDLNSDEKVREFFSTLASFRSKFGVHFVILHHTRKPQEGNKKPRELGDVYGNQYVTSEPDLVMSLFPERKNIIRVKEVKNRMAAQQEDFLIERTPNLSFKRYVEEEETFSGLRVSSPKGPSSGPNLSFS